MYLGPLSGPNVTVIQNDAVYYCGTQESFPNMADSAGNVLSNTAHSYMECSNKGLCDHTTGTCGCFEGYSGSACQFASCPSNTQGTCSGHGTCNTAKDIAGLDADNVYDLWDASVTMGCVCDPGYSGADCSLRTCKYGADPLYSDDEANPSMPNTTYIIYTQSFTANPVATVVGTYAIIFTDHNQKEWQTSPISINAECLDVVINGTFYQGIITALESLPNQIIPLGSVRCLKWDSLFTSGTTRAEPFNPNIIANNVQMVTKFTLVFTQNPGKLDPLQLNFYLDGSRATLYSNEVVSTLGSYIFSDGFYGEDVDYVPNLCSGVQVTLTAGLGFYVMTPTDPSMLPLMKTCLGGSDGISSDNVEVYNWDYGTDINPHLVKLIETTADVPSFIDTQQCHFVPKLSPMNNICVGNVLTADGVPTIFTTATTTTAPCNNFNPPGFFVVLKYVGGVFQVYTRAGQDYGNLDQNGNMIPTTFNLFTTTGYLQRISTFVDVYTSYGGNSTGGLGGLSYPAATLITDKVYTVKNFQGETAFSAYDGNVDCASNPTGVNGALACLNKNDMVMLINTDLNAAGLLANPVYPQIYSVSKVSKLNPSSDDYRPDSLNQITLDMAVNAVYTSFRNSAFTRLTNVDTSAGLFKFFPPSDGGVTYVSQCSGRGICDVTSGVCDCFPGYTSANCDSMDALAM